jgi:Protein of unknown function (DUF2384)
MTSHDPEWFEKLSMAYSAGGDSLFGDGNDVAIDLCPQCIMEALGAWLRITPQDDDFPVPSQPAMPLKGVVSKPQGAVTPEDMNPLNGEQRVIAVADDALLERAVAVFGDHQAAIRWLAKPQERLGGHTPLEIVRMDDGKRQVEALLAEIDEGYF